VGQLAKSILLAGFSESTASLLRTALESGGYVTGVLAEGTVATLDHRTVGLLLVDTSGRHVDEIPGVQQALDLDIPIVALSDRSDCETLSENARALPRPFRVSQLLDFIREVSGQHRA